MRSRFVVICLIVVLLLVFTITTVMAQDKKDKKDKKSKEKKVKKAKKKEPEPYLKRQDRKGLAVGPRIGAFIPMNSEIQKHLPFMAQSGMDLKVYPAEKWDFKWIGLIFGMGVMGGGDVGTVETAKGVDDDGNTIKSHDVDAYWGTTMIPVTLGITVDVLPYHVFDPYIGGGGGFYFVANAEPMKGLPPQYEEKWAPVEMDPGSLFGFFGVVGVDVKFHDYLGVKVEGGYHVIKGQGGVINNADLSGIMISIGPWVYF